MLMRRDESSARGCSGSAGPDRSVSGKSERIRTWFQEDKKTAK